MAEGHAAGKAVAISGTPGTGKSVIGALVSRALGISFIELGDFALEKGLYIGYDDDRMSFIVDENRLREHLKRLVEERGSLLVVGHYSEIVDDEILDKIIVLRINPVELASRLVERGWPMRKVVENVEAELMGICTINAVSEHPAEKVCEVDVSSKNVEEVSKEVIEIITGSKQCRIYVDWLSDESAVSYVLSLASESTYFR